MAKSNKFLAKNPPNPAVAIPAWGMLALALAFQFIPTFRTVALILYAADWLALAIAAVLTKRKQTLIIRLEMVLPMVASIFPLYRYENSMEIQSSGTIWIVTACFLLLTLPMLLAAEKQVPDEQADNQKYWERAAMLALVVLISAHSWACVSNAVFDQSAGSPQTAQITEKWRERQRRSWRHYMRVAAAGETLTFQIGSGSYDRASEGDAVTVTEHPGFWGAPYWTWKFPDDAAPSGAKPTESAEKTAGIPKKPCTFGRNGVQ